MKMTVTVLEMATATETFNKTEMTDHLLCILFVTSLEKTSTMNILPQTLQLYMPLSKEPLNEDNKEEDQIEEDERTCQWKKRVLLIES